MYKEGSVRHFSPPLMISEARKEKKARPHTTKVLGLRASEKRPMCIGRSIATSRIDLQINSSIVASSRYRQEKRVRPSLFSAMSPDETARDANSTQDAEDLTNAETERHFQLMKMSERTNFPWRKNNDDLESCVGGLRGHVTYQKLRAHEKKQYNKSHRDFRKSSHVNFI